MASILLVLSSAIGKFDLELVVCVAEIFETPWAARGLQVFHRGGKGRGRRGDWGVRT